MKSELGRTMKRRLRRRKDTSITSLEALIPSVGRAKLSRWALRMSLIFAAISSYISLRVSRLISLSSPDKLDETVKKAVERNPNTENINTENVQDNYQFAEGKPVEIADGTPNLDKKRELPSAKLLLTSKPPFEDSDMIKLYPADSEAQPLIKSPNTVVTGYFRVASKYNPGAYDGWMVNMLSLQDAMVIFTQPDLVDEMKHLRSHAVNRTVIIPMSLDDLPIGKFYEESFWQDQLDRDPEKKIHRSYQLFWIWLSKSWSVAQAIRMNVYDSDIFVWSDIGCFRHRKFNSKTMVVHRETVPRHEILQMAHHKPNPPDEELYFDKYKKGANFYHSGSQFVGYKDTLLTFHEYFLETIDRFLEKEMIIVDDQCVLQSVCLSHPEICAYAPTSQVNDNHYFGLRTVLHHGGEFNYWRGDPKSNNVTRV